MLQFEIAYRLRVYCNALIAAGLAALLAVSAHAADVSVPYVPTPQDVVEAKPLG